MKGMESLQRLLASSRVAKLLAIRKVGQENGGIERTPGIDGVVSTLPDAHRERYFKDGLNLKDYVPMPVRRVFIPKAGGTKLRPLGIPAMKDRALQCLVKLALEPEWEAVFEPRYYGFRPVDPCKMQQRRSNTASGPQEVAETGPGRHDATGYWTPTSKASLTKLIIASSFLRHLSFAKWIEGWLKAGTFTRGGIHSNGNGHAARRRRSRLKQSCKRPLRGHGQKGADLSCISHEPGLRLPPPVSPVRG